MQPAARMQVVGRHNLIAAPSHRTTPHSTPTHPPASTTHLLLAARYTQYSSVWEAQAAGEGAAAGDNKRRP